MAIMAESYGPIEVFHNNQKISAAFGRQLACLLKRQSAHIGKAQSEPKRGECFFRAQGEKVTFPANFLVNAQNVQAEHFSFAPKYLIPLLFLSKTLDPFT